MDQGGDTKIFLLLGATHKQISLLCSFSFVMEQQIQVQISSAGQSTRHLFDISLFLGDTKNRFAIFWGSYEVFHFREDPNIFIFVYIKFVCLFWNNKMKT